ncbi:MAG: hypothetical protein DRJ52_04570 [Thermoprotei archaeon]|nr:MAG: hypothetical protein DRJ52_04570 [Thermoprotei archaeon]RLF00711.1 MAG: hypothetical protein DRJ63_01555 [Thermoprotei archaeon]
MNKDIVFWYHLPVTQSIDYIRDCALKAAQLGFDVISHQDHFLVKSDERGCRPECWVMLTAIAVLTEVKVSPLVMCSLFRNPVLVAKIVTTIDQLTKGRVFLGIGAGWWQEEFEAYGYPWEPPRIRVDKTIEAIKIIKMVWTQEEVNYEGKYWKINNCRLVPRPYQKPHPPIFSGGHGPRMLRATAKYCDGWVPQIGKPEDYKKKMEYMSQYMKKPGKFQWGNVIDVWEERDTPEDIIRKIEGFTEIGVKHFILYMHPQPKNLELLDKYSKVVSYFK